MPGWELELYRGKAGKGAEAQGNIDSMVLIRSYFPVGNRPQRRNKHSTGEPAHVGVSGLLTRRSVGLLADRNKLPGHDAARERRLLAVPCFLILCGLGTLGGSGGTLATAASRSLVAVKRSTRQS